MEDANHAGHSRKNRGEAALSQTYYVMGEITGKRRKQYLYCLPGESKICLIQVSGNSSSEFKVLVYFGAK